MKTYSQKAAEIKREWWVIDASSMPLGKLAVVIADKLMGKSKVTYTPHIDNGDYVVVTNAKKLVATGDKMLQKKYYRHIIQTELNTEKRFARSKLAADTAHRIDHEHYMKNQKI